MVINAICAFSVNRRIEQRRNCMISKEKIQAFRQYLQEEFLGWEIADTDDFDRISWKFRVANESTIQVVYVQRRFWDDYGDTKKALMNMGLSKFMKDNEGKHILVATAGPVAL
jgi:hypothetical protein